LGFLCLLPTAILLRVHWPQRTEWPAVAMLGACFFGLFFVLYNIAIGYTTAARASLALATLPLQTMVVGALLGIEPLTIRKCAGVAIAMLGVLVALASGLAAAPPGAWRGELIMTGAVLCMAFYNVWSRPFIRRSSALGFLTVGMGAGAAVLLLVAALTGRLAALAGFGANDWIAGIYLGVAGGALAFMLWVLALERASPTRVANTMTVNPVAAALLATVLVDEPVTFNLVLGLVAVFFGIWLATMPMPGRTSGQEIRNSAPPPAGGARAPAPRRGRPGRSPPVPAPSDAPDAGRPRRRGRRAAPASTRSPGPRPA
jgi:drug/metabolite transporter (DMT)-like permease